MKGSAHLRDPRAVEASGQALEKRARAEIKCRLASLCLLAAFLMAASGCASSSKQRDTYQFQPSFPVEDPQFRRSLDNIGGVIVGGNSAVLLENGDGVFPAMLEDIRKAKVSINLETYIFKPDEAGRRF